VEGKFNHELAWRGLGLRPLAATKGLKDRLSRIRRMFFTFAFLFAAWPSYEGGEKQTTAKNKGPDLRY